MPDYDYRCVDCKKIFTINKSYDNNDKVVCPFCKGTRMVNIISKNIWVKYKGKGFTKKVKPDKED